MNVKELIQELLNLPLDKDVRLVTPDNSVLLITYLKFNKVQDQVDINSEEE